MSRWLFLRLLAIVYLLALVSLAPQLSGLIGTEGLLPVDQYLERARSFYGLDAYRILPTLFWFSPTNSTLVVVTGAGIVLALLALAGVAPALTFALLWAVYLSLTVAGQTFLSFQWDVLLLEAGLLACLYAPLGWWPGLARSAAVPRLTRWLLWILAFKVTFLSGITKLVSGDATWRGLTALQFHYETQPLPAWTSWFAHHLPDWMQMASVLVLFVIELAIPFGALAAARFRRVRAGACGLMCLFQLGIAFTGNYGFFNLLTVVIYLALLDDHHLGTVLPQRLVYRARSASAEPARSSSWRRFVLAASIVILCLNALAVWREVSYTRPQPVWLSSIMRYVQPFRSVNGYGLFRTMTTERPEIVVEGSEDGVTWTEYAFRWKPGALDQRPAFVQPHMPRLDWLMWFAALDPPAHRHWLTTLVDRLLDGSPAVRSLLDPASFPDRPPRYVRLAYYQYAFTSPGERDATGNWWRREFETYLTNPISRDVSARR